MNETADASVQGGLTDVEKRRNLLRLVFEGSDERFEQLCRVIREEVPADTRVIVRGSALTGRRWRDVTLRLLSDNIRYGGTGREPRSPP